MFELGDGTLGTLAAPAPPKNIVTGRDIWGDDWTPIGSATAAVSGLTYPPAWQAIRQLSGDGASLDCPLKFLTDAGDWETQESHPLNRLMNVKPNDVQIPSVFRETLWHHALWVGDGRSAIIRDGNQMPLELIPLLPDRTWTMLIRDEALRKTFKLHATNVYNNYGAQNQGRQQYVNPADDDSYVVLEDKDVFHFPGLSYDGISGYNVAEMFKRTLGIGTSSEGKIKVTLERSGIPPLVLIAPPGAFKTEEDARLFLQNWNQYHAGVANSGKTGLLREGIKPEQLAPNNRDDQFEEIKKLTRQDVASIFNIPVQMLGDTDAATLNNVEQMFKWYNNRSFRPWAIKWNQEASKKLLSERMIATGRWKFEYNLNPLQFVDADSKARFYDSMRKNNAMSGDDIRESEGLPRVNSPDTTSYANPNTSSSAGGADEPVDNVAAVKIRCRELAKIECNRLHDAADCVKLETFQRRIDKQLSMHAATLTNVCRDWGGDSDSIAAYISNRKSAILERCAQSGNHSLEPLESEDEVARLLYDSLFGGNGHV